MNELWVVMECKEDRNLCMVGVFDSEEKALAACLEFNYFLGPVNVNEPFPVGHGEWVGCYWPKIEEMPSDWKIVKNTFEGEK